jgi:hypothetical protein
MQDIRILFDLLPDTLLIQRIPATDLMLNVSPINAR